MTSETLKMAIPRELNLPLPFPEEWLKILLVIFFLLHILFVNLMVGGSIQVFFFEILGLKKIKYDNLSRKIADTITVNKSLAAVLGVGPILCISLVYTNEFYTANILTGHAWIALIPLITSAFLLAYLHKYTWDKWSGDRKKIHIFVGGMSTALFLFIPLIFLSNINLMLFPERWGEVAGFISSLKIGNVIPRYLHFFVACNATTGLFLVWWFGKRKSSLPKSLSVHFTKPDLIRLFYKITLYFTLSQFIVGPLLLFTLPSQGLTIQLISVIFSGVLFAVLLAYILMVELNTQDDMLGRFFFIIVGLFSVIVIFMGTGRHLYREASLAEFKGYVRERSYRFRAREIAVQMRLQAGLDAGEGIGLPLTGEKIFTQNCAACHAMDKVLVGPAIKPDIFEVYKDNPEGIVAWSMNPGKKRNDMRQMPSMAHVGKANLELVAKYMLDIGSGTNSDNNETSSSN